MKASTLLPLGAALFLTVACSQTGVRPTQGAAVETQPAAPSSAAQAAPAQPAVEPDAEKAAREAALPKQPLTPDILFKFLVGEVAVQRGAIGIAQSAYLDLARETSDPRIARRAAEVALAARDQTGALEATRMWAGSEPDSLRAKQTLAALLLNEGRLAEAEPILRELVEADSANMFLHLSALMGKSRDTQAGLALVQVLAADYPNLPEARFAVGQAAANAGQFDTAIEALKQADALRPGWEPAALMRAQILAKTSRADALAFMRAFLAAHAGARDVRLAYARTLVNANQFSEARAEFTRLTQDFPRNAEVSFAAGLLSLQMGDLDAARELLSQTLDYSPREPDAVYYYLGQVAEQQKQPDAAAAHYARVQGGNYLVPARARQAALLAQAELLRNDKQHALEFDTLSEGLKRFPDAPDLLYDRAMAAEKLDRLDVLEADLRHVIALRPDDAQAYNALGYTLADRTDRLTEAVGLLDKALSLAPNDPFILDSVGWAQFRTGNLVRAREYLERAFKARPDPEIAAHLGEVLWALGQRDAAGRLWQSSLQSHPQNEVLLETLHRLKP